MSDLRFADEAACRNTDRELWRERWGDFYADSLHVTDDGKIGINVGGIVIVASLQEWHTARRAALDAQEPYPESGPALIVYNEIAATDHFGSPLERLRFFCLLAMRTQDWLDVEPFFDALDAQEPTRKAATDEEMFAMWPPELPQLRWNMAFTKGFRAAERFHGIKEDKT